MFLGGERERRELKREWLLNQVESAIRDTGYVLSRFDLLPDSFGNAVVELSRGNHTIRLVQDRGDIYAGRREDGGPWTDLQALFTYSGEKIADSYENLIKAVEQVVRWQPFTPIAQEIREVLKLCSDYALQNPGRCSILSIIMSLEEMLSTLEAGRWCSRNKALSRGLGYLIMDDEAIVRSELGHRLARISNAWHGNPSDLQVP